MSKYLNHLNFVRAHAEKTIKEIGVKHHTEQLEIYLMLMLDRLHNSTKGIIKLFPSFLKRDNYEYPLALIFRSQLMDTLMTFNLYIKLNEVGNLNNSEIKDELNSMSERFLAEGIIYVLKAMEEDRKFELISEDEIKKVYKDIYSQCRPYMEIYDGNGTPLLKKYQVVQLKQLGTKIKAHPTYKNMASISSVYDLFSKYAHFGIYSYYVANNDVALKRDRINRCVEFNSIHSMMLHMLIRETFLDHTFLPEHSDIIAQFCQKNYL